MAEYRKKPVVIEATQWFQNGDHPKDDCRQMGSSETGESFPQVYLSEGKVVRYFRHPETPGQLACQYCTQPMHKHGWIDTVQGGHVVCPRDWIITDGRVKDEQHGHYYPCKPDIFEATYEAV